MKKALITSFVILLLLVSAAYYYFNGKVYEVRFTEAQVKEKINEKLPFQKTYLMIFQVTFENPRIDLIHGSHRINAGLDVSLNIKLGTEPKPLGGKIDFSGGLKYVPEKGAFYLTDPIIENLSVQGIPAQHTKKVSTILAKALEDLYSSYPIYSLKKEDFKQLAARAILKTLIIDNKEIVVTLGL